MIAPMIQVIIFSFLVIMGVRAAIDQNEGPLIDRLSKIWILKPVAFCAICMTTVWTPIVYFSIIDFDLWIENPQTLFICWLSVPGLIAFIRSSIEAFGLFVMSDELDSLFNSPYRTDQDE